MHVVPSKIVFVVTFFTFIFCTEKPTQWTYSSRDKKPLRALFIPCKVIFVLYSPVSIYLTNLNKLLPLQDSSFPTAIFNPDLLKASFTRAVIFVYDGDRKVCGEPDTFRDLASWPHFIIRHFAFITKFGICYTLKFYQLSTKDFRFVYVLVPDRVPQDNL